MRAQTNSPTLSESPYINHSDEAEYSRLQALAAGGGFGDPIGDEDTELQQAMAEVMGYDVPDGRS